MREIFGGPEVEKIRYIERWTIYSITIGVVVGLASVCFYLLLQLFTAFFMGYLCKYQPPLPGGEAFLFEFQSNPNILLLALVPAAGGLISGFIIYHFAPEAEGHGTDAVIDAFHNKRGNIRGKVPLIKSIASAITIGSGGSGGREGPIALIGAGFGSFFASLLKLNERDKRELVICGTAAGVGSIFKSPLGGALFAIEVLYKRDFESAAMVPSIVCSVVAYAIFCSFFGWSHIFKMPEYTFGKPIELLFYAALGILCAAFAILYVEAFYSIRDFFRKIKIPNHFKPAIGGGLLGILVLLFPQTIDGIVGVGYGVIQDAIDGKMVIFAMLLLAFAKIFATSFSIGSGGSGGVFGPSLVIGAMIGGFTGSVFHLLFPGMITETAVAAFVIVGMASFFSGASKAPIASIIMVCEMTGSYTLLVPSMVASVTAYVLTDKWTIYESQVSTRMRSPAHRRELTIDVLEQIRVEEAMVKDVITISPEEKVSRVFELVDKEGHLGYPVVESGRLVGIVTFRDAEKVPIEKRNEVTVDEIATKKLVVVYPDESLEDALHRIVAYDIGRLPVVDRENPRKLLGIITRSDITRAHARAGSLEHFKRITGFPEEAFSKEMELFETKK
ncbi:MAG: chloride channel protein [Candidatus Syntropharchaeia archaeon]